MHRQILICEKWKHYLPSHIQHFATPSTVAPLALLPVELSRQKYWSGYSLLHGHLPDPGIKLGFPSLQADSLLSEDYSLPGSSICENLQARILE